MPALKIEMCMPGYPGATVFNYRIVVVEKKNRAIPAYFLMYVNISLRIDCAFSPDSKKKVKRKIKKLFKRNY